MPNTTAGRSNVLEWNLAADESQGPHTIGGCTTCLGALTLQGATVRRNVSYFVIAHASRFVRPGSVRVETNEPNGLPNVAFQRGDGKKVLIVLNETAAPLTFNISYKGKKVSTHLSGGAVATYVW